MRPDGRNSCPWTTCSRGFGTLEHFFLFDDDVPDSAPPGTYSLPQITQTRAEKPVDESVVMAVAGHCQNQSGVLIGRTNRSFRDFNNTIALSPALIATQSDIDEIVSALDKALSHIAGS